MPYPNYTSLPQYANILHLWKLDETSGTRSDFISTCHLTDNNTVLYGTGKISNAADFESDTSEYLSATTASSADMNFTTEDFSIAFWYKPESLSAYQFFIGRRKTTENAGWDFYWHAASTELRLLTYYNDATGDGVISNNDAIPSTGTWYHIVITRSGTTGVIYVDSVDETSTGSTLATIGSNTTVGLCIGRASYVADYYVDGLMDEVIVWNVALTSTEVSTLYNWYSKVGLSGAISFSGAVSIKQFKLLEGTIAFVGTLQKLPKKLLTGSISFIGALSKLPKKLLTGAITFTGTLTTKVKKTLTGAISFIGQIFSPYLDGIWSLFVKRTTSWTRERTDIYSFDFSFDDGNWDLSDATISSGVLDITADEGYGQRTPDANWLAGANDDFELEVDFKQDSTVNYGAEITLMLAGDVKWIYFDIQGSANLMEIYYDDPEVTQAFVDDTNWHTMKVRRVGTTYYMSIDGGGEISWNYGTARAIDYIRLRMYSCTGDFDNFKYYGLETTTWTAQDKEDTFWSEV